MRVLVTYGGMKERIDGVRSINNTSSGMTGTIIIKYLLDNGVAVTALKGKDALCCDERAIIQEFTGFDDLNNLLCENLNSQQFDSIIHLAAVSDYKVDQITIGKNSFAPSEINKLDSAESISVNLKRTPKLISLIRALSPNSILFGFKLTNSSSEYVKMAAIKKLFDESCPNFVVHNDLSEISESGHHAVIYSKNGSIFECKTKEDIATNIYKIIQEVRS